MREGTWVEEGEAVEARWADKSAEPWGHEGKRKAGRQRQGMEKPQGKERRMTPTTGSTDLPGAGRTVWIHSCQHPWTRVNLARPAQPEREAELPQAPAAEPEGKDWQAGPAQTSRVEALTVAGPRSGAAW